MESVLEYLKRDVAGTGVFGWFLLVTGNIRNGFNHNGGLFVIVNTRAILHDGANKGADFLVFGVGLIGG